MEPASAFPARNSHVIERFGKELLLFDSHTGTLFEINDSGKPIWLLCDGRHSVKTIERTISAANTNGANVLKDTIAFLDKLVGLDLITLNASMMKNGRRPSQTIRKELQELTSNKSNSLRYTSPEIVKIWTENTAVSGIFLVEM
jgi:hypothetical protein